jgi:hypothetical protein
MNWVEKDTNEYEMFWHITSKNNIDSIKEKGILQSTIGINGDGVYCVKSGDGNLNQLQNVINFMGRNGLKEEDQVIVEFEYLGSYFENEIGGIYEEDGWIHIEGEIPARLIERIIGIRDL